MERDDLYLDESYARAANHDEEHGKAIRKKIWFVTILLTVITVVEVLLGAFIKQGTDVWPIVKWSFVVMTIIKAGYIVLVFMHLGDEKKSFKYMVLAPYALFIAYLLYICLTEATYIDNMYDIFSKM